jgi:Zeta toxin
VVVSHAAAQWIRDELFRRALAEPAETGSNRVVFTAGGNASGKSSTVAASDADAVAQIVLDSTLSNPEHAGRLLKEALEPGKAVTVHYVNRPLSDALMGMIERAGNEGRVVTVDQLIKSQRGAAETARGLWDEYRQDPRVPFHFLDFRSYLSKNQGIRGRTKRTTRRRRPRRLGQ